MVGVSGLFVSVRWSAQSSWSSMKRASHSLPRRLSHLSRSLGRGRRRFASCRTFASCHDPRAARQRPCQACRASGRPTSGGRSRSRSRSEQSRAPRLRETPRGQSRAWPGEASRSCRRSTSDTLIPVRRFRAIPCQENEWIEGPGPRGDTGRCRRHICGNDPPLLSRGLKKMAEAQRHCMDPARHCGTRHAASPSQPFVFVGRPQAASSAETFPYPIRAGTWS